MTPRSEFLLVRVVVNTFALACQHNNDSGRCTLDVLQLSVQQEGEADMDVELLRKGLLAVKIKNVEEEGRARDRKFDGDDPASDKAGLMPGKTPCAR